MDCICDWILIMLGDFSFQSRYVGYFERVKRLHKGLMPPDQTIKLTSIYIKSLSGRCETWCIHRKLLFGPLSMVIMLLLLIALIRNYACRSTPGDQPHNYSCNAIFGFTVPIYWTKPLPYSWIDKHNFSRTHCKTRIMTSIAGVIGSNVPG